MTADLLPKKNPTGAMALVDFVERVVSTAFMAGYALWIVDPHAETLKAAAIAGGLSALKYVAKRVAVWQAANIEAS